MPVVRSDGGSRVAGQSASSGSRVAGWPGGRVAGWLGGRVAGRPGGRVAGWPGGRVAGWPGGWAAGWPERVRLAHSAASGVVLLGGTLHKSPLWRCVKRRVWWRL
ncbi:hypothetical protein [Cryptosporangium minutisporangium]|uniref:hypothetical protein n=1 Tax=Cryptosporangium minutisporangium TaxID=113569 RepID=UPI0035E490E1